MPGTLIAPRAAEAESAYVQVPVESLLPGRPLPFSVYYRIGDDHILFRGAGNRIEGPERDRLLQTHVTGLYIARPELDAFRQYQVSVLEEAVRAAAVPSEGKAEPLYMLAAGIAEEVLREPDRPQSIDRAGEVVRCASSVLAGGNEMLHRVMAVMSVAADLVGRSLNAMHFGLALARAAGIADPARLRDLGLGLLLEDVGLRKVPEHLLARKAPLCGQERRLVERHASLGADLLENLLDRRALLVILEHHERCDGSGYPAGRTARDLIPESRIAQIAVAFDDLTSGGANRPGVSSFHALRDMCRERPGAFDPELLRIFVRLVGRG